MSQENVDVVRRIFEGWETGDFGAVAAFLDQHVTWVVSPDFPEPGVFVGFDQIGNYMRQFLEQWEEFTMSADSVEAVGDSVLARAVQRGKGKIGGIEGEVIVYLLFTFRGDKIIRIDTLRDKAEALEAAGLSA